MVAFHKYSDKQFRYHSLNIVFDILFFWNTYSNIKHDFLGGWIELQTHCVIYVRKMCSTSRFVTALTIQNSLRLCRYIKNIHYLTNACAARSWNRTFKLMVLELLQISVDHVSLLPLLLCSMRHIMVGGIVLYVAALYRAIPFISTPELTKRCIELLYHYHYICKR